MISIAEHEPPDRGRGDHLLLVHCAAVGDAGPTAYARLEAAVGGELARLLLFALTGAHGRLGSSSP